MKAFFDSSVLVAVFYGAHVHHAAGLAAIQTAAKETASCAAHTLAEAYSVLTRLPVRTRISPEQGLLFIKSVRERFNVVIYQTSDTRQPHVQPVANCACCRVSDLDRKR